MKTEIKLECPLTPKDNKTQNSEFVVLAHLSQLIITMDG